EYDIPGLEALLPPYSAPQTHVIIEEAQAMPGQGVRSMFTCGLGFGVWLGMLATLWLDHTRVRPGVWKRALGLSGDKEQACLRAMNLYSAANLRRKKDHGRAEALLLAYYGWRYMAENGSICPRRAVYAPERTGEPGRRGEGVCALHRQQNS